MRCSRNLRKQWENKGTGSKNPVSEEQSFMLINMESDNETVK